MRTESKETGKNVINIIRQDKNLMWMLMPEDKIYMEMKNDPTQWPKVEEKVEGEVSRKFIGNEKIDGWNTKKYEVTYKNEGKLEKFYQWYAEDIKIAVKTAAIDGSWSYEFKNIKLQSQPDNLFEIPKGYQKMSVYNRIPGMGSKK